MQLEELKPDINLKVCSSCPHLKLYEDTPKCNFNEYSSPVEECELIIQTFKIYP